MLRGHGLATVAVRPTRPAAFAMSTPEPCMVRLKALARVVDGDTLDLDLVPGDL